MSPGLDNTVRLRVSYFRRLDGSVYEVVNGEWRSAFTPEIIEEQRRVSGNINAQLDIWAIKPWPWEKRCTALVKSGPCALVLYRGGGR